MNYIFGKKAFIAKYRSMPDEDRKKTIWIILHTSDGESIYLENYDQWLTIQDYCDKQKVKIDSIGLKWRTHLVETETSDTDGLYLVKTAKGVIGGPTRDYYTIGKIYGDKVQRTMWSTPDLLQDLSCEDKLANCIQKAVVIYDQEARDKK